MILLAHDPNRLLLLVIGLLSAIFGVTIVVPLLIHLFLDPRLVLMKLLKLVNRELLGSGLLQGQDLFRIHQTGRHSGLSESVYLRIEFGCFHPLILIVLVDALLVHLLFCVIILKVLIYGTVFVRRN